MKVYLQEGLDGKLFLVVFLIGISTLIAFYVVYRANPDNLAYAQTIAFATLVLAQLIHVFDCRSERSIFSRNPFGNKYLVGAVLSSLLLMLAVIYYAAFSNDLPYSVDFCSGLAISHRNVIHPNFFTSW